MFATSYFRNSRPAFFTSSIKALFTLLRPAATERNGKISLSGGGQVGTSNTVTKFQPETFWQGLLVHSI
jgi:hypothetical protein